MRIIGSTAKAIGVFRFVFVVIAGSVAVTSADYGALAAGILIGVAAVDTVFSAIKRRWRAGNADFKKIMDEELGHK